MLITLIYFLVSINFITTYIYDNVKIENLYIIVFIKVKCKRGLFQLCLNNKDGFIFISFQINPWSIYTTEVFIHKRYISKSISIHAKVNCYKNKKIFLLINWCISRTRLSAQINKNQLKNLKFYQQMLTLDFKLVIDKSLFPLII